MKQTILALSIVGMLVLSIGILYSIFGKEQRREEIRAELSESVESTMNTLMAKKLYSIDEADEFIGDFIEAFFVQVNSDSDFQVNILYFDEEKGILQLEVESIYEYPNGREGKSSIVRNVAFEMEEK